MIKCDKNEIILEGDELTLKAEASVIICAIKDALEENGYSEESVKEQIQTLVEVGMMPEDERKKKAEEMRKQIVLEMILGGLFK